MRVPMSRFASAVAAVMLSAACGGGQSSSGAPAATVTLDGSSTVFPVSEAVAEEFQKANAACGSRWASRAPAAASRSSAAARPTSATPRGRSAPPKSRRAARAGITFIELPVAYDGLAVVANPKATWVEAITTAELKTIWAPEAQDKVARWSQVRAGWPDRELHLFGAGVDSGTYDYFTQAIVGKEGASRGDFTSSEDDNVLVQGISGDELALGFMPYAYYAENKQALKLVPVDDGKADNGAGPILPSVETVKGGTYQPLSRPIFIYVSIEALDRPEVASFVEFYLAQGGALAEEVGYVPLGDRGYQLVTAHYKARTPGSVFEHAGSQVGLSIEQLLARESK